MDGGRRERAVIGKEDRLKWESENGRLMKKMRGKGERTRGARERKAMRRVGRMLDTGKGD